MIRAEVSPVMSLVTTGSVILVPPGAIERWADPFGVVHSFRLYFRSEDGCVYVPHMSMCWRLWLGMPMERVDRASTCLFCVAEEPRDPWPHGYARYPWSVFPEWGLDPDLQRLARGRGGPPLSEWMPRRRLFPLPSRERKVQWRS